MSRPSIAFFCMPDWSHFQRVSLLVADLARTGASVHVFTDARLRAAVEQNGAHFVDLFSKYPFAGVDDDSWPEHLGYVTFAGEHAEAIRRDVERLGPDLIVHDTFAVIGGVVARLLGIPHVNVCAGHNFAPARFVQVMRDSPRVRVSARCLAAVETLRVRHGIADASPFLYVTGLSPYLNVYCEPSEFLTADERRVFEPIAFYGSVAAAAINDHPAGDLSLFGPHAERAFKVYIAFGTVVWSARQPEGLAALDAIVAGLREAADARVVIGLGGGVIPDDRRAALESAGAVIQTFVDQRTALRDADVFVTHHGLKSTHEAIWQRVPMISYPFFGDQPALAALCQRLGLAVPLVPDVMGAVRSADVRHAVAALDERAGEISTALERAREWEVDVIRTRPAVIARLLELTGRAVS